MDEDYEDDIVSEGAEYSPKSDFSKAIHVSEAVKIVRENRSKEMKAGYMNSALDKQGNEVKTWVPDTRKIYVSSVDALRCLLTPERRRGKEEFKKLDKAFTEDKKKIWNKYAYEDFDVKKIQVDNSSASRYKIEKNKEMFLPDIDDQVKTPNIENGAIKYEKGYWNQKVKAYWTEILELYDQYLEELNVLIDDINYFKTSINF